MFSGNAAPEGWAFCNGERGTPDLRNRFIACGNTIDEKGESPKPLTGEKNRKTYSVETNKVKTELKVTVNDTALTTKQLPEHSHYDGMRYHSDKGHLYDFHMESVPGASHNVQTGELYNATYRIMNNSSPVVEESIWYMYRFKTSSTGAGEGHKHEALVSEEKHSHNVDIIPPYYLLAFIMKL
ncbi:conserved hypothetical protein [Xenorhabdus bovienii str. kraussei Becker Underwood]|uniref:Phage tail collar domain-containing protein n=2 Tax=Xenorhabdus bovienii TaxID=40576 RepID=A0A077PNS6_XENBV|nr:conserved hypothetical protein [Xenorhabdus bovienii str. kraussei Becker Underwood]